MLIISQTCIQNDTLFHRERDKQSNSVYLENVRVLPRKIRRESLVCVESVRARTRHATHAAQRPAAEPRAPAFTPRHTKARPDRAHVLHTITVSCRPAHSRPWAAAAVVRCGRGAAGPGSGRCPRCRRGGGRAARVPLMRFGASEGGAALGQRGAAVGAGRSTSVCRPSITTGAAAATTSPTGTEARTPPPPSTPPPGNTCAPTAPASGDKGSAAPREATQRGGGVIERTSELLSE